MLDTAQYTNAKFPLTDTCVTAAQDSGSHKKHAHPQRNSNRHRHLQLERQSEASFRGGLLEILSNAAIIACR
jgi:hypothetical protein